MDVRALAVIHCGKGKSVPTLLKPCSLSVLALYFYLDCLKITKKKKKMKLGRKAKKKTLCKNKETRGINNH